MKTFACTFIASAFAALVLTPLVARIALKLGIVDRPGPRKIHSRAVPRIGGVAIVIAMLGPTMAVMFLSNVVGEAFRAIHPQVMTLLGAGLLVFLVGLVDDIRGVRALLKLLGLTAAALAVCISGTRIDSVVVAGWFALDFGWLAWPITIIWILTVAVGVNFIDGLDGLAGGIAAIACGVIAVFAIYSGQLVMAVLMLALLGSLAGFLVFNFNPAKVFMGDCGSLFLGFVLGSASVMCAAKTATLVGLALPAMALGVPVFDAMFTMVRRGILERRSIFAGERGHIHHRLLAMGLKQRQVVLIIYAVTAMAAGLGMFMMVARDRGALVIFACLLVLVLLVFRIVGSFRLNETLAAIRRNWAIRAAGNRDRGCFEVAQLKCRQAKTFDVWWNALCVAAEEMDFVCVSLTLDGSDGSVDSLVWRHPSLNGTTNEIVRIVIPPRTLRQGVEGKVELDIWVNGSLESAGRRAALFGRLLDEHCPAASSAEDASEKPGGRVPRFRRLSLAISKE